MLFIYNILCLFLLCVELNGMGIYFRFACKPDRYSIKNLPNGCVFGRFFIVKTVAIICVDLLFFIAGKNVPHGFNHIIANAIEAVV